MLNSGCPTGTFTPTYSYDAENRLIATGGISYAYDGDGKRVKKSNGMLYWAGIGSEALLETDLSGNPTAEYVFFNGRRIARIDRPANTVEYYFSDHLGSTDVVTNSTGTIVKESDYYPYGGEIPIIAGDSNRYKFSGKERDTESGLDNFGARYDSSSLGRFMTPDWAARPTAVPYAVFGDPQSLNLYGYVRNDPVSRADLDGHAAEADAIINRGDSSMFGYGLFGIGVAPGDLLSQSSTQNKEIRAQQQASAQARQAQKTDDPNNLRMVVNTDSGSDHYVYRGIEYGLETKDGKAPNENWYISEKQTNTNLAGEPGMPPGTSAGKKSNYFKDSVGGSGTADSKQTFWISRTPGKLEFQTFVHTNAGDYGEIAIHIQHSGYKPGGPKEGAATNGFLSWPGATYKHYEWPGPHP